MMNIIHIVTLANSALYSAVVSALRASRGDESFAPSDDEVRRWVHALGSRQPNLSAVRRHIRDGAARAAVRELLCADRRYDAAFRRHLDAAIEKVCNDD